MTFRSRLPVSVIDPSIAVECSSRSTAFNDAKVRPTAFDESPPKGDKAPPAPEPSPAYMMVPGPSSYHTQPVHDGQTPIVYRYVHPETGEQIASLLPPNHPEMMCLQSGHVPHTSYGILGMWLLGILNSFIDKLCIRYTCCGILVPSWRWRVSLGSTRQVHPLRRCY